VADDKPIIIIKKKGGHGGHHGGAWKVAYADFVTAMMAFFMVMWLVNSAETITKQNIASYFRKPGIFETGSGTPLLIGEAGILQDGFVPPHPEDTKQRYKGSSQERLSKASGTESTSNLKKRVSLKGEDGKLGRDSAEEERADGFASEPLPEEFQEFELERARLNELAEEIKKEFESAPDLAAMLGIVDVKVESDGLNIEIMDTEKVSMFALGSARINNEAQQAFAKLAALIQKLPNTIDVVGHTDARPFSNRRGGYSNWELSADRANAARRLLEQQGIEPQRITSVMGRADQEPRNKADPMAAANRRITLKMRLAKGLPGTGAAAEPATPHDFKDIEQRQQEGPAVKPENPAQQLPGRQPVTTYRQPSRFAESLMLNYTPQGRPDAIKLPNQAPPTENPPVMPRDKIFGDSPVLPRDPFAGF